MNRLLFIFLTFFSFSGFSQVSDDFTDGNFTATPVWSGDAAEFIVNGTNQLQLNATIAGASYLSTPNVMADLNNKEWRCYVKQTFAGSASNYGRVYLVSDQTNLEGPLNGYYLQFGEALGNDAVELFEQTGTISTSICRGTNAQIAASFTVGVQVKRDAVGLWTLSVDATGGTNYVQQATGTNTTHTTSAFMGVADVYTVGNITKFFYDDFYAGAIITDVAPPTIVSATVISSTQLDVLFNEDLDATSSQLTSNYSANNSLGAPSTAILDGGNARLVHLTWATPFTNGLQNTLTVNGVQDIATNPISNGTINFTLLTFSTPTYKDVVINEIMVDVSPVPTGVPARQYLELYNKSANYFDLNGWKFADAVTTITIANSYTFAPNSYVLIAKSSDTSLFIGIPNKIGTATIPSYNLSGDLVVLKDNANTTIDSISYTTAWYHDLVKDDGGWSLEMINPNLNASCDPLNNWAASSNANGGTPGVQNSVYSLAADVTAPQISSTTVVDSVTLTLCFNEAIDAALISNVANYSVTNAVGNPLSATASSGNNCVTLVFATAFTSQLNNTITVSTLADCSGNVVSPNTSNFTYVRIDTPQFGEIILTEIMVDVNPIPVGVPAKQYIELYNTTSKYFNLNGFEFADAVSTSAISSSYVFAPNSYVLIAKSTDTALFTGVTNKVGTSTFPTFNTTGDPVFIYDNAGNILDSIRYTQAWYNDLVKDDGGWSLELINPTANANCLDQSNWTASSNTNGGTPGLQNSVYSTVADVTAPAFSNISVIDSVTVQVCFNEAISASLVGVITNYSVNGGIGSPNAVSVNSTFTCATLSFSTAFTSQTTYTLNFATLADCSGNIVSTGATSFTYIRTDNPIAGDVIVNELMIDVNPVPTGLPASQYVELYNKSTKYFNLNNWQLSDRVGSIVINQNYVFAPGSYVLIARAADTALFVGVSNKIGTSSLPSFNTTGDGVYLQDNLGNFIDSLNYTDDWYNNSVKDDGGWSLELINPTLIVNCDDAANWTGSNNANGGTPGTQNSVYSTTADVAAPIPQYVSVTDSLHITVCFNEAISSNLISTTTNYSISNGIGNPITASVSASSTKCIDLVLASALQNPTNYVLTLTNLSDCSGNAVSPATVNFSYYIAKPYDVVINELFADPDPQVALPQGEYIELYNRTAYAISLKNWTLTVGNNDIVIPDAVIQPDSFVVFMDDAALNSFVNEGYGNRALVVLNAMSSSELNVSDEDVVIKDANGTVISFVHYYDSWYQDAVKEAGGWSLEQIDPNNPCAGQSNWRASNNANGGTPGAKNSIDAVNADNQLPQIVKVNIINKDTITLVFNESIQYSSMNNVAMYSINNGIGIPVSVTPKAMEYKQVTLALANSLQVNSTYTLTVSGSITDCAGNVIAANSTIVFGRPDTLLPGDIIINEVMFAPKTDGIDYVELRNISNKILDLKDLYIGEGSLTSTLIEDSVRVTYDGYIMFPGDYVLLSENGATVKSQYATQNPNWFLDMDDLPSMNSDEDVVVIVNVNGVEIDKFAYYDKMHFALLNDTKGVSLEKIDSARASMEQTNWNSAASNVGFGTPGYRNSQAMLTLATGSFSVVPEIFSPDNDGYNDVVTINYEVSESGLAGNITIYNSDGQFVRYLARNENLASKGSYSWNGITEQNEKAPIGIYVIYFETFNKDGKVEKHKLSCVLAGKL
jgi:P pilus assembly chaperone PapD